MTSSMRAIPLAKLVDQGWLIPVPASTYASAVLAPLLANEEHLPPDVTPQRYRDSEEPSFLPTSTTDAEGQEGFENGKLPDPERILKEMPA